MFIVTEYAALNLKVYKISEFFSEVILGLTKCIRVNKEYFEGLAYNLLRNIPQKITPLHWSILFKCSLYFAVAIAENEQNILHISQVCTPLITNNRVHTGNFV